MGLFGCKKCGGTVVEAEKKLNLKKETTELVCINCGKYLEVNTKDYIKLLDRLNVDYSRRI